MNFSKKLGLGLFLNLILLASPSHSLSLNLNHQQIAGFALMTFCSNTVHEMGHAIAQKCLTGVWPDTAQVGVGFGFVQTANTSVFSLPCPAPDLRDDKGFHPECWSHYDTMLAMGPIPAAFFNLILYYSWGLLFAGETLSYLQSASKVLMLMEFGNLVPMPYFMDGAKILKDIYPDAGILTKTAIALAPVLAVSLSTREKSLMNLHLLMATMSVLSPVRLKLW